MKYLPSSRALSLLAATALATVAAVACSSSDEESGKATACADDKVYFQEQVWTKVLSGSCVSCHSSDGAAKGTRLVLSRAGDARDQNYRAVVALANPKNGTLLLDKPTGRAASHGGGALLDPASPEAGFLKAFLDRQKGQCGQPSQAASLNQRQIRRLTRDEYGNTLRDLLGVEGEHFAAALPADTVADGFDNQAGALQMSTLFVDKARTNAEEVGEKVDLTRVLDCKPKAGAELECVDSMIRSFGSRAFRRPITDAEVGRYRSVYGATQSEGFEQGVRAIVTTMIQSPNFLFRTELGEKAADGWNKLTPYEIASELSYLFWKSMPDAELFDAAKAGTLSEPEVVLAQAKRLLASPKAHASMARFVDQWLELDRLPQAIKDEKTYPGFDDALRNDLHAETVAFFDHVARSPEGTFKELLTANYTYVTGKAASFYGITPGPDGRAPVNDGRLGILTQASILAVAATPSSASPIRRGKLVREKFFCQSIPPPPPGLSAQLAAVDPNLPNRERFTKHSTDKACASCHRLMDPIGFGFEAFDGVGKPVASADVSGEITGTDRTNGRFNGVVELESKLAESSDAQECFARLWVRYAYGIKESDESRALASELAHELGAEGTKLTFLFASLVRADHVFRRRADAGEAAPNPGAPSPAPAPAPGAVLDSGTTQPPSPGGTSPGLDVKVENVEQYEGYQRNVTVTNLAATGVDWSVKLPKSGAIYHSWNTDFTEVSDGWVFVGKSYNKHLDPGQTTTFGFQAK